MSPLDLQEAQVGVSLALQIFDEFFIELQRKDENLQQITFQVAPFGEIDFIINEIRYIYEDSTLSSAL